MERRRDVSEVIEIPQKKKNIVLKRILISVLVIFMVLIFASVVGVMFYMNSIGINFIDTQDSIQNDNTDDKVLFEDIADEEKDEYYDMMTAIRDDSDLSSQLYSWYTNGGDHMASNNVLNILIVGIDASGGVPMEGNSDVMMLASVDKKGGKITLCSFLRDSYTYFETSSGNGYYSKLNAAYANGGADCLINAIEYNYKIDIDYFVAVDFEAFEKVIDAIGGINLDVTEKEARAMEDYANITGVPYGENVLLSGEHALLFARMRKIYVTGDVQRSQNQRKVINAIIKKSKTLSISDLNNVVQTLGEYIYTDCPATKIVSLGTSAIIGKWYDFQVYSMEAPPLSARKEYNGNSWMWLVDYPYSAQYVQKQIYGESNIVIQ
ncbi:MAG: LCP family protein [Clostridia bacterium]|nr:LCP family protein [Clostridia bacterium]